MYKGPTQNVNVKISDDNSLLVIIKLQQPHVEVMIATQVLVGQQNKIRLRVDIEIHMP